MTLSTRGKILTILAILALLGVLPLILYLQKQQQEIRSKAQAATTLSFSPQTTQSAPLAKSIGDTVSFDVMLDPGTNWVSLVKLDINYDPTILAPSGTTPLIVDTANFPETLEGLVSSSGSMKVTVGTGSDQTKVVKTTARVATITFQVIATTGATPTSITFGPGVQILSIASGDQANENVYAGGTAAYLSSAPPPCTIPAPPTNGEEYYEATIEGNQVVPPTSSTATGKARVVVGVPTSSTVQVSFCYTGLSSINNDSGIHIAAVGQVAPETLNLPASAATSGFTNNMTISVVPQWIADLRNGLWYIQIGSLNFSGGEIRGQFGNGVNVPTPTPTSLPITQTPTPTITPTPTWTPTPVPPTPTRTPTPTITPPTIPQAPTATPTPTPVTIRFNFTVFLHGIGNSGDNTNETAFSLSNHNPLTTTKSLVVELFESDPVTSMAVKVLETTGNITYQPTSGNFTGVIDIGTSLQNKPYIVKIKTDKYFKKIAGNPTVNPDSLLTVQLPPVTLSTGDSFEDNTANINDYNLIYSCYSVDSPPRSCTPTQKYQADLNDDGNVNQYDYNLFLREIANWKGE